MTTFSALLKVDSTGACALGAEFGTLAPKVGAVISRMVEFFRTASSKVLLTDRGQSCGRRRQQDAKTGNSLRRSHTFHQVANGYVANEYVA